ncbi:MAG: hypothetical protein ABI041_16020 [Bdellovibrionia bacterium]
MKILNISWMDDEKKEGILSLANGENTFQVYCYPCSFQIGDTIVRPLQTLQDQNIVRVGGNSYTIQQIGDTFETRIIAKVEDKKNGIVSVNQIKIELDSDLPGDILEGETVSFETLRLTARKT